MSASNPSKPTLDTLPAEIFEMIADEVDAGDLLNLRLASRDIEDKVRIVYTDVFFTSKFFILSDPASMRTALQIAQHPVFGPALQKITFLIDELRRPRIIHSVVHTLTCKGRRSMGTDQPWFLNSGQKLQILTRLFTALRDAPGGSKLTEISIANHRAWLNLSSVMKMSRRSLNRFRSPKARDHKALTAILDALYLSNTPLRKLSMLTRPWAITADCLPIETLALVSRSLSNIVSLDLVVTVPPLADETAHQRAEPFFAAISRLPHLESLKIHQRSTERRDEFFETNRIATFFETLVLPALKDLTFSKHGLSLQALMRVAQQQPVLERLTALGSRIWGVPLDVFDGEGKEEVLSAWLTKRIDLEEVVVDWWTWDVTKQAAEFT